MVYRGVGLYSLARTHATTAAPTTRTRTHYATACCTLSSHMSRPYAINAVFFTKSDRFFETNNKFGLFVKLLPKSGPQGRRQRGWRRQCAGRRQASPSAEVRSAPLSMAPNILKNFCQVLLAPTCTWSAPSSLAPTRDARFGNIVPQRPHMLLVIAALH